MPDRPLKPWMGYVFDKRDGCALVFARNYKEARVQTWHAFASACDCEYIDTRAHLLRDDPERFMAHCTLDEAHGILDIPEELHCGNCQFWGMPLDADGLCRTCAEDKREWDAWAAGDGYSRTTASAYQQE